MPFVEDNIIAGPAKIPVIDATFPLSSNRDNNETISLRIGAAICFDLDFPNYIIQAGRQRVDLFLQPSWTWLGNTFRHLNGNAVRTIENGFNLLRCSSMGESGVVSSNGLVSSRRLTGSDPNVVVKFQIPIEKRITTFFVYIGFVFEYLLIACEILIFCVITWDYYNGGWTVVMNGNNAAITATSTFSNAAIAAGEENTALNQQWGGGISVAINSGGEEEVGQQQSDKLLA